MKRLEEFIDKIRGNRYWDLYRLMMTTPLSMEALEKRLKDILLYSKNNIEYYKNFKIPNESNPFKLLRYFPLINKQIINSNFTNMQSKDLEKRKSYFNFTGGSTGIPLKVLQDKNYDMWTRATKRLFYSWAGWKPGEKILKIWGSEREVLHEKNSLKSKFSNLIRHMKVSDCFKIDDKKFNEYISIINKYKPHLIETYVDAAYTVAQKITSKGIELKFNPKSIITSAGTLYPEFKNKIEEAFESKVFNRYGCREAGDIACTAGDGNMYVNNWTHVLEIVKSDGEIDFNGSGRILVTLLTNYSLPLIRYEIGDYGMLETNFSGFKYGFQKLSNLEGRSDQVFKNEDGTTFSPAFFIHFIGVVHNEGFIEKFQVVQEQYDLFIIKLVLTEKAISKKKDFYISLEKIEKDLKKVLGNNCEIKFKFVEDIPKLPSGKFLYTVSKLNDAR